MGMTLVILLPIIHKYLSQFCFFVRSGFSAPTKNVSNLLLYGVRVSLTHTGLSLKW